jgi:hypothetical protein
MHFLRRNKFRCRRNGYCPEPAYAHPEDDARDQEHRKAIRLPRQHTGNNQQGGKPQQHPFAIGPANGNRGNRCGDKAEYRGDGNGQARGSFSHAKVAGNSGQQADRQELGNDQRKRAKRNGQHARPGIRRGVQMFILMMHCCLPCRCR